MTNTDTLLRDCREILQTSPHLSLGDYLDQFSQTVGIPMGVSLDTALELAKKVYETPQRTTRTTTDAQVHLPEITRQIHAELNNLTGSKTVSAIFRALDRDFPGLSAWNVAQREDFLLSLNLHLSIYDGKDRWVSLHKFPGSFSWNE